MTPTEYKCFCGREATLCPECHGAREVETAPIWSDEYDIVDCFTCEADGVVCVECEESSQFCECPELG